MRKINTLPFSLSNSISLAKSFSLAPKNSNPINHGGHGDCKTQSFQNNKAHLISVLFFTKGFYLKAFPAFPVVRLQDLGCIIY